MTPDASNAASGPAIRSGDLLEILVVDADPVVCEGLRVLLRSEDVRVANTAADRRRAVAAAEEMRAAAALVAVTDDPEVGYATARAISTAVPGTAVLLYARGEHEIGVLDAVAHGAAGVVSRRMPVAKVADALRWVAGGGLWLDGEVALPAREERSRTERLSRRELDVLERMAQGRTTEEIAAGLRVTPHTVRTHVRNLLQKLGAHTRAHAVAIAMHERAIDVAP